MKITLRLTAIALLTANLAWAQTPQAEVERVSGHERFKRAEQFVSADHDRTVRETISLNQIEAPPFKEAARARVFMQMLKDSGLTNVEMDAEGNVMGLRKGIGGAPLIAIAAHLDTVFPEGTDVKVKQEGTRLMAPGIGDNSRSLAILLAMIRAMAQAQIQTTSDILFIGNVGEEGSGDLRGMRYLFEKGPYKDRIQLFISVDGVGDGSNIVNGALGSKRYRVNFRGPGGHSYGAFGIVNPAYALAKAVDRISKIQVPGNPRTTFNVGAIGGGTSVNSIPHEVWMDVDLRSESPVELRKLEETFLKELRTAVTAENTTRGIGQGQIELEAEVIGDRPSGETPVNSLIVQTASAVVRKFGMLPKYYIGSTDANLPISLKIPAITIDSGGSGGRTHALDEWIDVEKTASVRGIVMLMTTLLSLAGLQ